MKCEWSFITYKKGFLNFIEGLVCKKKRKNIILSVFTTKTKIWHQVIICDIDPRNTCLWKTYCFFSKKKLNIFWYYILQQIVYYCFKNPLKSFKKIQFLISTEHWPILEIMTNFGINVYNGNLWIQYYRK